MRHALLNKITFDESRRRIKQTHPEMVELTGGGIADLMGFIAMSDLFEPHDAGDGLVAHTGWLEEEYPVPEDGWARCEHHVEQLGPGAPRPCRRVATTENGQAGSTSVTPHP